MKKTCRNVFYMVDITFNQSCTMIVISIESWSNSCSPAPFNFDGICVILFIWIIHRRPTSRSTNNDLERSW